MKNRVRKLLLSTLMMRRLRRFLYILGFAVLWTSPIRTPGLASNIDGILAAIPQPSCSETGSSFSSESLAFGCCAR
ncbi:hypothetical protein CDL15_Pgr009990 [Punica granatum]|uniref:Uncharacterized protein n=1 Tax=Punica granatum TaxID=22663 RepID=A0A218X6L3_PUNGR|nr:hypothetical protein CDL15_Pgr009990 [Punica granatum]